MSDSLLATRVMKCLSFVSTTLLFAAVFGVSMGTGVVASMWIICIYGLMGRGEYASDYYKCTVKNAWTVSSPLKISNLMARIGLDRTLTRHWLLVELVGETGNTMVMCDRSQRLYTSRHVSLCPRSDLASIQIEQDMDLATLLDKIRDETDGKETACPNDEGAEVNYAARSILSSKESKEESNYESESWIHRTIRTIDGLFRKADLCVIAQKKTPTLRRGRSIPLTYEKF